MKIIVDAMGGDHAPLQIVSGAVDALNRDKNLTVVLVGDENAINKSLAECKEYDKNRLDIIDAKDVITNDDTPTTAIRTKKESSLVKAFDALVHDDEAGGFVSAGATGAVLVGAYLKVGRIKGVTRPALAPVLPTLKGNGVVLCDCGANVDCKSINLVHFAIMASAYATAMLGAKIPAWDFSTTESRNIKATNSRRKRTNCFPKPKVSISLATARQEIFSAEILTLWCVTDSTAISRSNPQKARQILCFHSSKRAYTAVD